MRSTIVVLILIAPIAMPLAAAQDAGPGTTIQATSTGFSASGQQGDDRFLLDFDLASAAGSYQVRYGGDTAQAELEFAVVGVAEFRDVDGDGRYGLGDETVRLHRLAGAPNATLDIAGDQVDVFYPWITSPGLLDGVTAPAGVRITFHLGRTDGGGFPAKAMEIGFERAPRSEEGTRFALLIEIDGEASYDGVRLVTVQGDGADALLRWQGPPSGPIVGSSVLRTVGATIAIATPLSSIDQPFVLEAQMRPRIDLPSLAGQPLVYAMAFLAVALVAGAPVAQRWRRRS